MPGKGYKVLSVKEEVVTRIQDRAKKEEVSISKLLDKLLNKSSTDTVKVSSNNTVQDIELTDKDIKKIAGQMELAIGMYIETGVIKAVKSLR